MQTITELDHYEQTQVAAGGCSLTAATFGARCVSPGQAIGALSPDFSEPAPSRARVTYSEGLVEWVRRTGGNPADY